MYAEDRQWNMEQIMDWNDKFNIELEGRGNELLNKNEDEVEQESMMVETILSARRKQEPRVFCKNCRKHECHDCENLKSSYLEEDREI